MWNFATSCSILLALAQSSNSFTPRVIGGRQAVLLRQNSASPMTADASISKSVVAAERFVVQNQFRVKKGREAAFEKRWADRESRLGTLEGFRYFCIMRRVDDEDAADDVSLCF